MEITTEIAIRVFDWLDVPYEDNGDYLTMPTVCHGGNSHKLYFYKNTKQLICYTNCGHMDLINFVSKVMDISNSEAFKIVINHFNVSTSSNEDIEDNPLKRFKRTKKNTVKPLKAYNDSVLNNFYTIGNKMWHDQNISYATQSKFEIKFSVTDNAIIIPHRYVDGSLVGIRQRNLNQKDVDLGMKYVPTRIDGKLYNYPTGQNLYGFFYNKKEILKTRKIILFEAEKSVMKLDTYFKDNNFSVALSGHNITSYQIDFLKKLPIDEIIIAFDKDYHDDDIADIEALKEIIIKKYSRLVGRFNISIIWDDKGLLEYKNSPTDQGKETFKKLFAERKMLIND